MYEELIEKLRNRRICVQIGCDLEQDYPLMREAADAIEELQDDNKALDGTVTNLLEQIKELGFPKWISVEERLPKEGEFVLVYGDLYPNRHDGGVMAISRRLDWNYWTGLGRERNISHWMPLPTVPKEAAE